MGKTINNQLAAVIKCKCGGVVAATVKGHFKMNEEFQSSMLNVIDQGGSFEIVDIQKKPITVTGCTCEREEENHG